MSVNVNQVYTTTQAILNIEQRGFLAPNEFNKYALQSQQEIFEQYFYDLAHFGISRKGMIYDSGYSEIKKNLEEKINIFAVNTALIALTDYSAATERWTLPTDLYRLNIVYYNNGTTTRKVPEMNKKEKIHVLNSPLTTPTAQYPKYERLENEVKLYPLTLVDGLEVDYVKIPATPIWGYIALGVNRVAEYNPGTSTNFELHIADQYVLVQKILGYAGVQLREVDIVQYANQEEVSDNQNKKQ